MTDNTTFFFFSSRRRHTRLQGDWSSDVCSSDLEEPLRSSGGRGQHGHLLREAQGVSLLQGRAKLRQPQPQVAGGGEVGGAQDRKSTRLNSSHLVISYAVFCLKKKKKEYEIE